MVAPFKIGIIGGGMMSQVGHLPFYLGDSRCEVVRIAETRPSLVSALGSLLGPERIVSDYRTILDDVNIEGIVVSVPRAATGPLALEALEAGKHLMSEKPMAHSVAQAQLLVEAAGSRGLIYALGFMKRHDPGVQAAKALFDEVVAQGSLGRLLIARFYDFSNSYAIAPPPHVRPKESRIERFPTWPQYPGWLPERYRSVYPWFLNMAGHDVNLLRLFFPRDVEVLGAHSDGSSAVIANFRKDDVSIVLEITKSVLGRWVGGADFVFEHGQIRLALPSPMAVESVGEVTIDDERRGVVNQRIATGNGWSFARQASNFLDVLAGTDVPATNGEEGLADMVLTEQIWRRIAA